MSKIETCYLRDDEGCDLESCADCGYYKLVVESANNLQQLKAEIAALVNEMNTSSPVDLPVNLGKWLNKLRQLSAV